jgi:hypothetical protein
MTNDQAPMTNAVVLIRLVIRSFKFVCELMLGAWSLTGLQPCLCLCRALLQTT